MKNLIVLLATLFSLSSFASIDDLVGEYTDGATKESTLVISKILVAQPTLFEPAKYEYLLSLDAGSYSNKLPYLDEVVLNISEDGESLVKNFDQECDDADCLYFLEIDITASVSDSGKANVKIVYDGLQLEGEGEEFGFEGEAFFTKK